MKWRVLLIVAFGMAVVVAVDQVDRATSILTKAGEKVFRIGVVQNHNSGEQVVLENTSKVWPC